MIFRDLQTTAQNEGRSVSEVSAALGLAAAQAGIKLGNAHIFDFYRDVLQRDPGGGVAALSCSGPPPRT